MEKRYLTKWGEFCQLIYKNNKLTEEEKKELVDNAGATILEAMKQSQKEARETLLKTYR